MKKFLSLAVFVVEVLFFVLYTHLIMNSRNLLFNSLLIVCALSITTFFKALTVDAETNKMIFEKKEFLKLLITEDLIKFVIIMAFMLWFNKIVSGFGGLLIALVSFVVYGFGVMMYYWLQKKYKNKQLAK